MILLLDGDIDELVYATQASFEDSDLITSGSEATPITEKSALQVTKENEAVEPEAISPRDCRYLNVTPSLKYKS
jgi:hypothetical protein